VSLIGTWRQQSASGITWSGEQQLQGVTAGIDLNWTPSLRGGAFAGAAKAELVVDDEAQEIDTDNIWGGGYVGSELGDYHMELAALAGWQSNESVRRMVDNTSWPSGVAYADASYDGFFVSPQASISRDCSLIRLVVYIYHCYFRETYHAQDPELWSSRQWIGGGNLRNYRSRNFRGSGNGG